jgi:LPXTG-motif cell wall-anchored protein
MTKGWAAFLAVLVAAIVAGGQVSAQARWGKPKPKTFSANTTSVHTGKGTKAADRTIALTGKDCQLPAGVTGEPEVRVTLTSVHTGAVVAGETFSVSNGGTWSGTLTVGPLAASGTDMLEANCFASPQAEGVLVTYQSIPIIVTAKPLPATGFTAWSWTLLGVALLTLGAALLGAGRRRGADGRDAVPGAARRR